MAHEYGHHIQDILGLLDRAQQDPQGATSGSVRTELMADCLAGVWANHAATTQDANGKTLLKPLTRQDIDVGPLRGLGGRRRPDPEAGHRARSTRTPGPTARRPSGSAGSPRGYTTGSLNDCDTFSATSL